MHAWALILTVVLSDGSMIERPAPVVAFGAEAACRHAGDYAADRLTRSSSAGVKGVGYSCVQILLPRVA